MLPLVLSAMILGAGFSPDGMTFALSLSPGTDIDLNETGKIIVDADADTVIWSGGNDDEIHFEIGGSLKLTLDATTALFAGNIDATGDILFSTDTALLGFGGNTTADSLVINDETFVQLNMSLGANHGNHLVISDSLNAGKDYDHGAATDPTVFVHSATDPDSDNTEWLSLTHDQTDAVLDTGKGNLKLDDDVTVTGNLFVASGNIDLEGTGILVLDADGDTSIQASADDTINFNVNSTSWMTLTAGAITKLDDVQTRFGTNTLTDARMGWVTAQTPDALVLGLGQDSNGLILMERADYNIDMGHALQTNPTLFIHSADATDTADWISLTHDQTDAVIDAGNGDIKLDDDVHITGDLVVDGTFTGSREQGAFSLSTGGAGTRYIGGFYEAPAADANLNEGSLTQTLGSANVGYGAHAFALAGAAGAKDAGTCTLVVSGTSVTDAGVRTGSDTEVIVADVTAEATDGYSETVKKWVGQVTYTLTLAGGATTCNFDFNYGFAKYYDHANMDFTVRYIDCQGVAGANDTGFNIELLEHSALGWTYHASAFVPGDGALADMNTTYNTEINIANGVPFAYKLIDIDEAVTGSGVGGYLIRVTTGAANSIDILNCTVGVTL